ncbi:hypothetical protein BJF93_09360 [Xaviernesmea oryzae]|uniref:Phosphatase n=1 Tax=Xaviernesmea oryzae TaxID=464029 RepID=A0A1Q9AWL5_9HYPH|nr:alkaline phosphatase PhoX [Xaviernesmea oryzae]OLP59814.1 hypothetical protein BJF93_09360 [Xaviernesmea oryzae]SEK50662.1 protein of unknown function [Xaviernesmea oryzae]
MTKLLYSTALAAGLFASLCPAMAGDAAHPTHVAKPVEKVDGQPAETVLSPELSQIAVAKGAMKLDGATGIFHSYGYQGDGPLVPAAGDQQSKTHDVEAVKTEPDKNTYLVLEGQKGADPAYDYGTHFLFQGHESAVKIDGKPQGYFTRINLDADEAHRVTLMATHDIEGQPLETYDGSTWDPFAKKLLLTAEEGKQGGVWIATLDYPSKVTTLHGVFGHASYEGVQIDKDGNIWLVEDAGGKTSKTLEKAKQPNSFVYRFTPKDKTDLSKGGKLQALQYSAPDGTPVTFHADDVDGDIKSAGIKALHTYGTALKAKWVTVHDTDKDGTEPFIAYERARAAGASPLKRPENGLFRPGKDFTEFYFTETGDTNVKTAAGREYGGFGAVLKIKQANPSADDAELSLAYLGDVAHSGVDNLAFWDGDTIAVVEDDGDTAHSQRKALDSGYLIDLKADYAKGAEPVRFIAEGRDPSATIDSALSEKGEETGFKNDGDNELTGIHVSDGNATIEGLLGMKVPTPFANGWRVFYTQQHGDNITYEIVAKK